MSRPTHALTIDVEDFESALVLATTGEVVPPSRAVVENTTRMLDLFEGYGVRATCFFLAEVAKAYPHLVRRAVDTGHEIACHGYHHHRVHQLPRAAYQDALRRAKDEIEQIAGMAVRGYRAAAATITRATWYAFDCIAEAGFVYDSSVFPFRGPSYGVPDAPLSPHWVTTDAGHRVYEVPLTVLEFGKVRLPCCGGGYLRHFPLAYTRAAMALLERAGRSAVFYLHPYEIDLRGIDHIQHPAMTWGTRIRLRTITHVSQTHGRARTLAKLEHLLSHHRFGTMREVFGLDRLAA